MIKRIKSSDKTVRPFTAFKRWSFSTIDNLDSILLEHDVYDIKNKSTLEILYKNKTCQQVNELLFNGDNTVNICGLSSFETNEYIVEKVSKDNIVLYENGIEISPEESFYDNLSIPKLRTREGSNISGTFYPTEHRKYNSTKELTNWDGTYQRLVYNNIKHLFYNDYFVEHYDFNRNKKLNIKNPLMLFGVESAEYHDPTVIDDIDQGDTYSGRRIERRVLDDKITVIEISQKNFGDKIKTESVSIVDNSSPYDTIKIKDDGYTNLITDDYTFSSINKIDYDDTKCSTLESISSENPFYFGKVTDAYRNYLLVGSPVEETAMEDSQSGGVALFKKEKNSDKFRCIRKFYCPFTQNGLSMENQHDHNNLLMKELRGVVLNDYSQNDNFGSAIQIDDNICAIGASRSHIRGVMNEQRTGHVFMYEKNKGGVDNWGITNIIEGIPGTEFGYSLSVNEDLMAIGAPGAMGGSGLVYIFKKKKRKKESSWMRLTDVPDGYFYDIVENKRKGYPSGDLLKKINKHTTRWKVKSVIPDGSSLSGFTKGKHIKIDTICESGSYPSGAIIENTIGGDLITHTIPDRIESGSIVSGNIISGCLLTGSYLSGSYLSGSFISGCLESGTISEPVTTWWYNTISGCVIESTTPTYEVTTGSIVDVGYENCISGSDEYVEGVLCPTDLITFDDVEILVDTIIEDEVKDFDSGYEPHEYTDTPDFAVGDTTWELEDCVFGNLENITNESWEMSEECEVENTTDIPERFGETVKIYKNRLYVGTPSSKNKIVYVFEHGRYCNNEWGLVNKIRRKSKWNDNNTIWNSETNIESIYDPGVRSDSVLYPYDYELELGFRRMCEQDLSDHKFGISIDVNDNYIAIGDSVDRIYKNELIHNEAGSVFLFNNLDTIEFGYKLYSLEDAEEQITYRFGHSISLYENNLMVGSHSIDMSKIFVDEENKLKIDDYFIGSDTSSEEFLKVNNENLSMSEGKVHFFRLDKKSSKRIKTITSTKQKLSPRHNFGYSVSMSADFSFAGSPVLGSFPSYELSTFTDDKIDMQSSESIFAHFNKIQYNDDTLVQISNLYGSVFSYDSPTITEDRKTQIGNIFYRNGVVVLNNLQDTYMNNFMKKSGVSGYKFDFKGTHTLYETEILCKVQPHEFNFSTNPTSLERLDIPYDINKDGKFNIFDIILIFKFLTESIVGEDEETTQEAINPGIVIEQDSQWPNADILMTESEDVILNFFIKESDAVDKTEYMNYLPYLNKLKSEGMFDVNQDGVSDSLDAKLILRYFRGNSGTELIKGLVNKYSRRRVANDIMSFLDSMTGKLNGIKVLPDFQKYQSLDRLMKHGKNLDSLKPHVTTIGLYDGLSLVGIAKLGKPIKITDSYPINFLVKYDG